MTRIPTIGVLAAGGSHHIASFKEGLGALGFVEGISVKLETHAAAGDLDKLASFAEQVRGGVDLVAAIGAVTAHAVRRAARDIPIIYAVVIDPVSDGLAEASGQPRDNMTGVTTFDPCQAGTHIGLLRSVAPRLERIAVLADRGVSDLLATANIRAIDELALHAHIFRISGPVPDLDGVFAAMERERAEALIVLEHPVNAAHRARIAEHAMARRLSTVFARDYADAGGLFCYGTSLRRAAHRLARYAKRILDGSTPGDLPIESFHQHELVVNSRTARDLGLALTPDVLDRATKIIK